MFFDTKNASEAARKYFRSQTPLISLGWGMSGIVYASPDGRRVAKVLHHSERFDIELKVYRRLGWRAITNILGLTVRKLRDSQKDIKLICIDIVKPPYLLDFAGASLSAPDFTADVMANWHADIEANLALTQTLPTQSITIYPYDWCLLPRPSTVESQHHRPSRRRSNPTDRRRCRRY